MRLMATAISTTASSPGCSTTRSSGLIGPVFCALARKRGGSGRGVSGSAGEPLNLFWFAHHTVLMVALARLPAVPCLDYGNTADLERQLCEFILRGIGLNEAAIASHLDRELSPAPGQSASCRKCMT